MIDGKRNGHWIEYYADGVLMWEGVYASGKRVTASRPKECNCQLDFMDDLGTGLQVGEAYRFRIRNGCLHDDDLALAATKSTVKRLRDTSGYNYILYPEKQETIKLMVYAADEGFEPGPVCAFEIPAPATLP